jgi:hypothetical protein
MARNKSRAKIKEIVTVRWETRSRKKLSEVIRKRRK